MASPRAHQRVVERRAHVDEHQGTSINGATDDAPYRSPRGCSDQENSACQGKNSANAMCNRIGENFAELVLRIYLSLGNKNLSGRSLAVFVNQFTLRRCDECRCSSKYYLGSQLHLPRWRRSGVQKTGRSERYLIEADPAAKSVVVRGGLEVCMVEH